MQRGVILFVWGTACRDRMSEIGLRSERIPVQVRPVLDSILHITVTHTHTHTQATNLGFARHHDRRPPVYFPLRVSCGSCVAVGRSCRVSLGSTTKFSQLERHHDLEPHETTSARLPLPRTYLKPHADAGYPARPCRHEPGQSESRDLPLSAPELIKRNPNKVDGDVTAPSDSFDVVDSYPSAAPLGLKPPTAPTGVTLTRRRGTRTTRGQEQPPTPPATAEDVDSEKNRLPPPLTPSEQALATGQVSGAHTCRCAQGEMSAALFGRAIAAMPWNFCRFGWTGLSDALRCSGRRLAS